MLRLHLNDQQFHCLRCSLYYRFDSTFENTVLYHGNSNAISMSVALTSHGTTVAVKGTNSHDDVIKWKHFPCYWPFVRGITGGIRSQRPVMQNLDVSFDMPLNKQLSKQSRRH